VLYAEKDVYAEVAAGAAEHARKLIAGPVLPVLPFTDLREIAAPAGAGMRGGAAGVWSSDVSRARQAAAIVHAGTVWVNSYRVYDAALPFGEPRHAGWGPEILGDYLDSQSIIIQTRNAY
jgi:aldehyde dehydrogenase (NAD+)/phenylacetaldehyde dehydrogenase